MQKKYVPPEHAEAVCLMQWARLARMPESAEEADQGPRVADWLIAIPNGGARSVITGARLKAEGVQAGVADYLIPLLRHGCAGLWLELKRRKGGRLSAEQGAFMGRMSVAGYAVAVAHGADEAILIVREYVGI
jgi:hypothetical protein